MDFLRYHPYWKMFVKNEDRFISWASLNERVPYLDDDEIGRIYTYKPYDQYTDTKGIGYFFFQRGRLTKNDFKYLAIEPEEYMAPVWALGEMFIQTMDDSRIVARCSRIYIGAIRHVSEVIKDYW